MSASRVPLGLPEVPPGLKQRIFRFLQLAEDFRAHDPIATYWSAFYAAQIGISVKAREAQSREVLGALLTTLERMKAEIGTDTIDNEAASAAYVENLALKLFSMADDEDRAGKSSRSTAKKFLAAANFLEVLRTFPKSELAESNEEKLRYAKWKAVDISKAIREGRKPIPGPAVSVDKSEEGFDPHKLSSSTDTAATPREATPGGWNTDATFGMTVADTGHGQGTQDWDASSTRPQHAKDLDGLPMKRHKPRSASGSSTSSKGGRATSSGPTHHGVLRKPTPSSSPSLQGDPFAEPKNVHFTSSVTGDSVIGSVHASPKMGHHGPDNIAVMPTTLPQSSPSRAASIPIPPSPPSPRIYAPLPPRSSPRASSATSLQQGGPSAPHLYAAPTPMLQGGTPQIYGGGSTANYSHSAPSPPPELAVATVAKVQKHCRFAISALDYDDAEQARKELRAALVLLGGL